MILPHHTIDGVIEKWRSVICKDLYPWVSMPQCQSFTYIWGWYSIISFSFKAVALLLKYSTAKKRRTLNKRLSFYIFFSFFKTKFFVKDWISSLVSMVMDWYGPDERLDLQCPWPLYPIWSWHLVCKGSYMLLFLLFKERVYIGRLPAACPIFIK